MNESSITQRRRGINAALLSAIFFGLAPIFGKRAIQLGMSSIGVVTLRTVLATLLLLLVMVLFQRKYLFIYPAGLLGCLLAGWINGLGSLFYYNSLELIDAGVGQLIYSIYPLFVALWLYFDRQPITRMTMIRLALALPALFLLIQFNGDHINFIGAGMMLVGALLYALHLPINQRVLYDIPAPTVTLYTLAGMSSVVLPVYLFSGNVSELTIQPTSVWWPVIGLTLVTFFSRMLLFAGVKRLGGMQTALLGLSELIVTLAMAQIWLGENLTLQQWIGAALLGLSIFLISKEPPPHRKSGAGGWFSWIVTPPLNTADIQRQIQQEIEQELLKQTRNQDSK